MSDSIRLDVDVDADAGPVAGHAQPFRRRPSSTPATRCRAPSSARSGSGRRAARSSAATRAPRCGRGRCRSRACRRTRRECRALAQRSWIAFDAVKPPTRPGLMLMILPAAERDHVARASTSVIDSSRQIGVDIRRCSSAWRNRSSAPSGCSSISRPNSSSCDEMVDVVERVRGVRVGHDARRRAQARRERRARTRRPVRAGS